MTPAQRLQLGCRRTSEAASRLGDWLTHNATLLGLGQGAVLEDLDGLSQRLRALAHGADGTPGIGLVSTDATAKGEVLLGLIGAGGQFNIGGLGPRPLDAGTLRRLLALDSDAGGAAVIRFSAGEPAPTPRGYPLRMVLLSLGDVAVIVTKAAAGARHPDVPLPTATDIDAVLADVTSRLSSQAIPGLSDGDVLELFETLNALQPGNRLLTRLRVTAYWQTFREIAAHISDGDRQLVLSLLWGRDKAFDALFGRMAQGLAKFGHGGDVYGSADALIGKDAATGWITRHPRSIIDAATLGDLAHPNGAMISVVNRFGQAIEVERGVLAALIGELPLHTAGGRIEELAPAEVLDFPVPHVIAGPGMPRGRSGAANDDIGVAIEHFARAKAIHLVERASLSHGLTSLVAIVDPDLEDDTFAPAIGDFVELAQGASAHARRRVRRGLHVIAAKTRQDRGAAGTATEDADATVRRALQGIAGARETWPAAWTPGRPLAGILSFERGVQQTAWTKPRRPAGSVALSAAALPAGAADHPIVTELVEALKPASEPHVRNAQLNQAFHEVQRRLNDCVVRHHLSNAPSALAEWRRGVALIIQDRAGYLIETRRLGHLLRALLPHEADLHAALSALDAGTEGRLRGPVSRWAGVAGGQAAPSAPTRGPGDPAWPARAADHLVDYWFKTMRRAARCGRMSRCLGVEPRIVQNLVDELQLGAIRTSVSGEVAQAYRLLGGGSNLDTAEAKTRLACLARAHISAFLELPEERARLSRERQGRPEGKDGEVADAGAARYSLTGNGAYQSRRRGTGKRLESWDAAFIRLVEDNIASTSVVISRGEKDRELGELLQLFAAGPFEVEL